MPKKQASVSANRDASGNQMVISVGLPPDKLVTGPCAGHGFQCTRRGLNCHSSMKQSANMIGRCDPEERLDVCLNSEALRRRRQKWCHGVLNCQPALCNPCLTTGTLRLSWSHAVVPRVRHCFASKLVEALLLWKPTREPFVCNAMHMHSTYMHCKTGLARSNMEIADRCVSKLVKVWKYRCISI